MRKKSDVLIENLTFSLGTGSHAVGAGSLISVSNRVLMTVKMTELSSAAP